MSKNVIEQALVLVQNQITKRLRSSISKLRGVSTLLSALTVTGERQAKSFNDIKEMGSEFHMGVVEVLATLDAFRSGYASNHEVTMDEQAATTVTSKSDDQVLALFDARFAPAVKAESDSEALGALRVLREVLSKALNWESTGSVTPTIIAEPDATTPPTSTPGSIEALQAANSGDAEVLRKADEARKAAEAKKAAGDEVVWARDMAKKSFTGGKNLALAGALDAVIKSEEPADAAWPLFDMAPRSRR